MSDHKEEMGPGFVRTPPAPQGPPEQVEGEKGDKVWKEGWTVGVQGGVCLLVLSKRDVLHYK